MKNKLIMLLSAALLLTGVMGSMSITGADAKPDSVEAPATVLDNQTGLSLFSCAATRSTTPAPNNSGWTVNHSHEITAESVSGHIIAFDCETYNPANLQQGCVHRTYYVLDNKPDGTDLGIVGPVNRVCWS